MTDKILPKVGLILFLLSTALPHGALAAGVVVLSNDDWLLSDAAFTRLPADTSNLAENLGAQLAPDGGSIHAYSNFFSLSGSSLSTALASAGYQYSVGIDISFDLPTISTFDGLMLGIPTLTAPQLEALSAYVDGGGNVYIHAGNGAANPAQVPDSWNPFLAQFELELGSSFNGINGTVEVVSDHPLFEDVSSVFIQEGHEIDGCCEIAASIDGTTLFAVAPVPLPAPLILLASAVLLLANLPKRATGRS